MSNKDESPSHVEDAAQALSRVISTVESIRDSLAADKDSRRKLAEPTQMQAATTHDSELLHWKSLVEAIRDIAADRPDISDRRSKDAWQGTALMQSSMLAEIARLCGDNLRSTTVGPRPLGTTLARGPRTEAIAERDGLHIDLTWIRKGIDYSARVYEPTMMDITPALADLLVLSVEEPMRSSGEHGI